MSPRRSALGSSTGRGEMATSEVPERDLRMALEDFAHDMKWVTDHIHNAVVN